MNYCLVFYSFPAGPVKYNATPNHKTLTWAWPVILTQDSRSANAGDPEDSQSANVGDPHVAVLMDDDHDKLSVYVVDDSMNLEIEIKTCFRYDTRVTHIQDLQPANTSERHDTPGPSSERHDTPSVPDDATSSTN